MDYFYCPPEKISSDSLLIDGDEYAHLAHVMRKKQGDEVCIVDGVGNAYDVQLGEFKKHEVVAAIRQIHRHHHEPSIEVTLAVGILKNPSKFDFLVEKVSEIGVKEIIPLLTERTIPRHAKIDRWQKLALAAMKQSGRSYLPGVRKLTTLEELLSECHRFDLKIIAHEKASGAPDLEAIYSPQRHAVLIVVGPEGGFSDGELTLFLQSGFHLLHFGNRRLRTETAAIVAASFSLLIAPGNA